MESNTINIPHQLAKRFRKNPLLLDLLCLSISIKSKSGSSRYIISNINKFMADFGVSLSKAKRLIEAAKECDLLFRYDEKNKTLIAKTYKTLRTITKDRKNRKIYQMYCMKINVMPNCKVGYIKREIHKLLILCAVNVKERMNEFHSKDKFPRCKSSDMFTLEHLANIAGVTRKSVVKYINQLSEEGRLNVNKGDLSEVVNEMNKDILMKFRRENKYVMSCGNGEYCVYYMTTYSIASRSVTNSFGNIIYNHYKRLTHNYSKNPKNIMETELMGAYN